MKDPNSPTPASIFEVLEQLALEHLAIVEHAPEVLELVGESDMLDRCRRLGRERGCTCAQVIRDATAAYFDSAGGR